MNASVIIPTRNRAHQLQQTLQSISAQKASLKDIEVIVVDNGSTDDTAKIVSHFNDRIPNLVYEYDDVPGLLTGRHRGIELAKSDIISLLDDDVELNADYIKNLLATFKNPDVHFATGPCLPKYDAAPPDWLQYFWDESGEGKFCFWLSLLDFGSKTKFISPMFVFGLNFCGRKSTIKKLGGFHPDCIPKNLQHYQGDGETGLALKAIAGNLKAIYEPGLALHHLVPNDRLTQAYFDQRAYYQGVCNSFTEIRNKHLGAIAPVAKPSFIASIKHSLYHYYWLLKKEFADKKPPVIIPDDVKEMQARLKAVEQEGYDFHQSAFNNDANVKDWVLRDNYWNYRLPHQ